MTLKPEASAALVFLILYSVLFLLLFLGYSTGQIRWRSRFTAIFFHVTVRVASQATGFAFGLIGYSAQSLLIAYFTLGAEGYFTLVLCTCRILISWQIHNSKSHASWMEPEQPPETPLFKKFLNSLAITGPQRSPMSIIHILIIVANILVVTGGSVMAGGHDNQQEFGRSLIIMKALRVPAVSIFLSINLFLLYCIRRAIRECKREHDCVHPTLLILLAAWPLLVVRGVYGVLASVIDDLNYFCFNNYLQGGLRDVFVISEYVLGIAMEWTACALLMLTWVTSRNYPDKASLEEKGKVGAIVVSD